MTIIAVIAACALVSFATWRIKPADGGRSAPAEPMSHTVERGETLSGISRRYYGTADFWPAIAQANKLKENEILRPGMELEIPGVHGEARSLFKSIFFPVVMFSLLTLLAGGLIVQEAAKSQQLDISTPRAAYAVLLTTLTGASVIAGALSALVLWPGILGLGIFIIPVYVMPLWVLLTAAEGIVLRFATTISHGRAVILGVVLNVIIGTAIATIAAFLVYSL